MGQETTRKEWPSYYTRFIKEVWVEPIEICNALWFDLWCAFKYMVRAGRKQENWLDCNESAIKDINKAISYLQHYIQSRWKTTWN